MQNVLNRKNMYFGRILFYLIFNLKTVRFRLNLLISELCEKRCVFIDAFPHKLIKYRDCRIK